jgi:hypothetical protein
VPRFFPLFLLFPQEEGVGRYSLPSTSFTLVLHTWGGGSQGWVLASLFTENEEGHVLG